MFVLQFVSHLCIEFSEMVKMYGSCVLKLVWYASVTSLASCIYIILVAHFQPLYLIQETSYLYICDNLLFPEQRL